MFFPQIDSNVKPVNLKREIQKLENNHKRFQNNSTYFHETKTGFQSAYFDPYLNVQNQYGNLRTADRMLNREVDPWTLRRVAKKAWIINICIKNVQDRIRPFLKPSTNRNFRGFVIHKVGEDVISAAGKTSKERTAIEKFLMNCGTDKDSDRDDFQSYCIKLIRDVLEIDEGATEIAYTKGGKPYAFFAVDGATIEKVLPGQNNPYNIKYVQLINNIPQAFFPEGTMIFDCLNPRSDVRFSFYGYSPVEQAIDLITASINTLIYNAGFFTENKLPRGMLLLDGNASQETVEEMEDYLTDIMSGSPSNQWRVPIVPAGSGNGENNSIKWVQLGGTNKEMEYQNWLDFLMSSIVALFGSSIDELGLHSQKSQPVFEHNSAPEIEASKSLVLGNILGYLQKHINKILEIVYPGYEFEFVGYERDDPKQMVDLAKAELESYKTLNEVRKEKGLKPLEGKWADECPANPQFTQMYQAASAQEGGGMEDMGDMDGGASFEGESETEIGADDNAESNVDENAWNEIDNGGEKQEENTEEGNEEKPVGKSLVNAITINL